MKNDEVQDSTVTIPRVARRTWPEYQAELKRRNARRRRTRGLIRWGVLLLGIAVSFYGLSVGIDGFSSTPSKRTSSKTVIARPEGGETQMAGSAGPDFTPNGWPTAWHAPAFLEKTRSEWTFYQDGKRYSVQTTLNPSLQTYISDKLDRKLPKEVAVVVLESSTGRVLALAGYDRADPAGNPCLKSTFPAASIFKIIIASAVVEEHGFTPGTPLYYNGRKYTLYKSQLKNKRNKYTRRITLRKSFAESVNPVFGKLGVHHLDMPQIEHYARAFGFEEPIEFEFGKLQSRLFVSQESYHRAEIASGFNRKTTISPVHGALIASAVLNNGKLMAPTVIHRVTNGDGETVYEEAPAEFGQAVSPKTASILAELMQATIRYGTARKAFRGYRYDKVLSKLTLGGKTGSISNHAHTSKYDWFVGFAREKGVPEGIAVAALVVHGDKLGRRAGSYARMAIKAYYEDYFSEKTAAAGKRRRS
jgi:cell division protein FtsI/penicillin-binding protein 2